MESTVAVLAGGSIPYDQLQVFACHLLHNKRAIGVESATPIANANVIDHSMCLPEGTQVSTEAIHMTPSGREVIPVAARVSTPVGISPAVTIGAYPPPLSPLLKEAMGPR